MKTHLASVAAVALLSVTGASAMLHITNPDYVVIINHEFETPSGSNFGGGFSDSGGGVVLVDNGAFKYQNTTPIITSCTVGSDGICRLPGNLIIGNRWPGEVIYASDILGGVHRAAASHRSREAATAASGSHSPLTRRPLRRRSASPISAIQRRRSSTLRTRTPSPQPRDGGPRGSGSRERSSGRSGLSVHSRCSAEHSSAAAPST